MDEWMLQAHSAHQTGLKPILYAVLILVESGGRGGRINAAGIFEIGLDFACTSTTGSPMDKWMLQAHLAHQIGPETSLQSVLIVVESGGREEELPRLCTSTVQLDSVHRLCTPTLYLDSVPRLYTPTLYIDSVHRLCNSTLQLDSVPRLCASTLYLDSVPRLCTSTLELNSIPGLCNSTLYLDSVH